MNRFVDSYHCNANETAFVACYRAISFPVLVKGEKLIPTELKSAFTVKEVTNTYGPFIAVKFDRAPFMTKPASLGLQMVKDINKKELETVVRLYRAQTAGVAFNWDATLIAVGQIYVAHDDKESAITGEAWNQYLGAMFDPHTHVTPMEQLMDMTRAPDEKLVGIGVSTVLRNGQIFAAAILPGGPAAKAGLAPGDVIISVDATSLAKVEVQDYAKDVAMIRGKEGTTVKVGVLRGEKTLSFELVRAQVVQSSNVESRLVNDSTRALGYVKFSSFMDDKGCDKIETAITQLLTQGAKGVILDLRRNGGGALDQAVCIGGLFVGQKVVVVQRALSGKALDREGHVVEEMRGNGKSLGKFKGLPLVVLQDAGSASASEILAGALQDYHAAWIVGDSSFGKGSVQTGGQLAKMPTVAFFETMARFYQPSGRTNQGVGITPDFKVPWKPDATPDQLLEAREADMYTNALPAIGTPWVQTRGHDIATVDACVKKNGKAATNYAAHKDDLIVPDYQLFAAQDILSCSVR